MTCCWARPRALVRHRSEGICFIFDAMNVLCGDVLHTLSAARGHLLTIDMGIRPIGIPNSLHTVLSCKLAHRAFRPELSRRMRLPRRIYSRDRCVWNSMLES